MKTIFRVFLVFALLLFAQCQDLFAQKDDKVKMPKNPKKIKKIADELTRVDYHQEALHFYLKLDSLEPNNALHLRDIGVCYLKIPYYRDKGLEYLIRAASLDDKIEDMDLYLGMGYQYNYLFDKSIAAYEKQLKKPNLQADVKKDIQQRIQECKNAKIIVANPVDAQIINLGSLINSEFPEFAPVISADETVLIFTSRRPSTTGGDIDPNDNMYFEDLYISEKQADGTWGEPKNMGDSINSIYHDASVALSPDGTQLFIYKDNDNGKGDLYVSKRLENGWSKPVALPEGINMPKSQEPSASITADGKTIYFSSDRNIDGAKGGKDIYRVKALPDGNGWFAPENLGPKINTQYDEDAPYIHPNGKILFFSSKGHNSMGGYDIFTAIYDDSTGLWSDPQNIGYPINSTEDDIYVVWSVDGVRGYFSSSRNDGKGEKDLYMISVPEKQLNLIVFSGKVFDQATQKHLYVDIEVYDNLTQKLITSSKSNPYTGKFNIVLPPELNYGIRFVKKGYLFRSYNIYLQNQFEYLEIVEDVMMQPLENEKLEVLHNIFYTEDAHELMVYSQPEIDCLVDFMSKDTTIRLEIAIHADNQADSTLSIYQTQARADVIVAELVSRGISRRRLFPMGYGADYPVASNQTIYGRKLNERVEYIVILDPNLKEIDRKRYRYINTHLYQKPAELVKLDKPEIGKFLHIENKINFKTGTNTLEESAQDAIDEILSYLVEFPGLVIEVGGHTDNVGSDSYNQKLSEKRAAIVAQQLVYRGIDPSRIKSKGYGESVPIADNSTQDGRNINRRTEFKVLSWGDDK